MFQKKKKKYNFTLGRRRLMSMPNATNVHIVYMPSLYDLVLCFSKNLFAALFYCYDNATTVGIQNDIDARTQRRGAVGRVRRPLNLPLIYSHH